MQTAESPVRDAQDSFDLMDYEMGLRLANRAIEKDPRQLQLRLRQAEILWKLGRREVAWMTLERMRTDDAVVAAWTGWEASAMAAFWRWQEGKAGESEILARDAAYRALVLLGSIRLERGERGRALEALDEAIRLQPDSPEAYLELGRVRLVVDEAEAAKAAFEKHLTRGGTQAMIDEARKSAARISGSRP